MIGAGKQPPKKGGNREMAQETKQELKRDYRIYESYKPGEVIGECVVCGKEIHKGEHSFSAWPLQNTRVFFCSACPVDQDRIREVIAKTHKVATPAAKVEQPEEVKPEPKSPEEPVTHEPLLAIPNKPQAALLPSGNGKKKKSHKKAAAQKLAVA